MGFDAIDAWPLANARYLKPMGMLNIWFGCMAKRGTGIALNLVKRSQSVTKKKPRNVTSHRKEVFRKRRGRGVFGPTSFIEEVQCGHRVE